MNYKYIVTAKKSEPKIYHDGNLLVFAESHCSYQIDRVEMNKSNSKMKNSNFSNIQKYAYKNISFFACVAAYIYYTILLLIGMINANEFISLYAGITSICLTFLLMSKNYGYYGPIIKTSFSLLIGFLFTKLLYYLSPTVSMPNCLKFLRLTNLGNTLTYISLYISIFTEIIKIRR